MTRTALLDRLAAEVEHALLAYSESLWAEADQHAATARRLRADLGLDPTPWWEPLPDRLPTRQEVSA